MHIRSMGVWILFSVALFIPHALVSAATTLSCTLSASPSIVGPGGSVQLSWNVQWSGDLAFQPCFVGTIDPGGIPVSGTTGSVGVNPWQSTTYSATFFLGALSGGTCGSYSTAYAIAPATCSADVTVVPPATGSIWFDANPIIQGEGTTLHWRTADADQGVYINAIGWVGANGDVWIAPSQSTDYSMTVFGSGGNNWYGAYLTVYPRPSCIEWVDANPILSGQATVLHWRTSGSDWGTYINSIGWTSSSGDVRVAPESDTDYSCYVSGPGGSGWYGFLILNVVAPPTATISANTPSISVGQSVDITAQFAPGNHDALSCTNIDSPLGSGLLGYCSPFDKSYTFTPSSAGDYTFYARAVTNYYGWDAYGSVDVHVNEAPPSCTIDLDSTSIVQGQGTYVRWSSDKATSLFIQNIGTVGPSGATWVAPSQTTDFNGSAAGPGGGSPCGSGTGTRLTVYPAPWCTVSISPGSIYRGEYATVSWNSGNASSMSVNEIGPTGPNTPGSTVVSPSRTTDYSCSVVGAMGSTANYAALLTVRCSPVYFCSGSTIMYTDANCSTSQYAPACESPSFCSPGSSVCQYPPISFAPSGNLSGHLQARPQLVRSGDPTKIYWNVTNVTSCTVTGDNGDGPWPAASSGSGGRVTSPIRGRTLYTLFCRGYEGAIPQTVTETQVVNVVPKVKGK